MDIDILNAFRFMFHGFDVRMMHVDNNNMNESLYNAVAFCENNNLNYFMDTQEFSVACDEFFAEIVGNQTEHFQCLSL